TGDGRRLPADLAVVGIGVVPNQALAAACGLTCNDGIEVDEYARTSDPQILACGDCTRHPNAYAGGERLRLESVQHANDQARTAAATILGQPTPYRALPWFWTDQFDVKLQMAGLSGDFEEEVLRGEGAAGNFTAFYYRHQRLVAADSVNRSQEHLTIRKLLTAQVHVPGEVAADPGVDLKTLLPKG
ncbi:MAG: oxidoreductase C-terminal domain-containing protein, partial [Candidatus Competibacterales bacterium]